MVGRRARGLLGLDLGLLRDRRDVRARPGRPLDAGRAVVHRRGGQLRRADPARQGRRRGGDARPLGAAPRARRAHVGRGARPGRPRRRGPARARRAARRPRRRLPAQHPRDDRRVPRGVVARRHLVELLAGLRPAQRDRSLRADRAEGAARRRRLPLRRQGLRSP